MRRATVSGPSPNPLDFHSTPPARKPFRATKQQSDFFSEVLASMSDNGSNLVLRARAGTGKSTTAREAMRLILERSPGRSIKYTCFNKTIADEFRIEAPSSAEVGTMHSFGYAVLRDHYKVPFEKNKSYQIMDMIGDPDWRPWQRKQVSVLCSHAKNQSIRPWDATARRTLYDLVDCYDVCPYGRIEDTVALALRVLQRSCEDLTCFDFDDMLWLPVILDLEMPGCDYLFIDEGQDLSPVQHELAVSLNPRGVTCLIGDPRQAIYAWRGADSSSMDTLGDLLQAKVMPLTMSWRCPTLHVDLAKRLVPDFEAAPNAKLGSLYWQDGTHDLAAEASQPGDLVLCRTNAPLIRAALKLVSGLRKVSVRGRAIGDQLASIASRIDGDTISDFNIQVGRWSAKEIDRLSKREAQEDQVEAVVDKRDCLYALSSACSSPSEILTAIDTLFADKKAEDCVQFSTVHRAKGSEAQRVTYLDVPYSQERDRKKPPKTWELLQRENLSYVAITRSLDRLVIATGKV